MIDRVAHLSDDEFFSCKHERMSNPRQRTLENGSIVYQRQCIDCGLSKGNLVSRINAQAIGEIYLFDEEFYQANQKRREKTSKEFYDKRATQKEIERAEFTEWYHQYLLTEKWKFKRQKVINRCNGICEGCAENPVTQVHHLTYEHVGNELLFELVGLCDECHLGIAHAHNERKPSYLIRDEFPTND